MNFEYLRLNTCNYEILRSQISNFILAENLDRDN